MIKNVDDQNLKISKSQNLKISDESPIPRRVTVEWEMDKLKAARYNAIHRMNVRNLGFFSQNEDDQCSHFIMMASGLRVN